MDILFFEGPEKKVELTIKDGFPSLREDPKLWEDVIKAAQAGIISKISNESCDAYLLSESSLFVYDDCFIMMTCGTTTLAHAVIEFLKSFSIDNVCSIIYERKNEHFPHSQPSSFTDDAMLLSEYMPGKAYRFGNEDSHHILLFHMDRPYTPEPDDETLEILMHGINDDIRELFTSKKTSLEKIRSTINLNNIFQDFKVDDHIFDPFGYSINAIKGERYYTMHVTPQEIGSYISFETNYLKNVKTIDILESVLNIFKPESFDIMLFQEELFNGLNGNKYILRNEVNQRLNCGYRVQYSNYFMKQTSTNEAFELPLKKIIKDHSNG